MDKSRPAADRVRPILQAMERSIDAARQRRLHSPDGQEADPQVATPISTGTPTEGEPATRLKAKPKRPPQMPGFDRGEPFQSRAS